MNERPRAQRFAARRQLWRRRNDVNVGRVVDNLFCRNRWRHFVFVPKEAHALAHLQMIQYLLIGHRPPANRQINRHQRRFPIVPVNFRVQEPRIDREMGQRFQVEITETEFRLVAGQIDLDRIRRD